MPKSLIKEAARRGKSEAERRDLQCQVDDAFYDPVDEQKDGRRRKQEKAQASRIRKERMAKVGREFYILALQLGWFGLCISVALNQAWMHIPIIDDFMINNDVLGYIAMIFIFFYGRKVINQLMGVEERR